MSWKSYIKQNEKQKSIYLLYNNWLEENVKISQAIDVLNKKTYIELVTNLINLSREKDSTVIQHSKDELLYRYDKSIVCTNKEWGLIWHIGIYPTTISELNWLNIGEMWSGIIDPAYRWKWLWYTLTETSIDILWNKYDALIWATINQIMINILKGLKFNDITFPKSYYEEGRIGLAPKLQWWEEEFKQRATCLFRENIHGTKDRILHVLNATNK